MTQATPLSTSAAPRHPDRIATLDGLRGIAILLVFCFHMLPSVVWPTRFLEWPRKFLMSGWVGVDLFFVLSGFLITGILLRAKGSPGYYRNFYMRRVLRIFPLYYGALFVVFVILPLLRLVDWSTFQSIWNNQWWLWLYSSNFGMYIKGHHAFNAGQVETRHFWSLSVEEHFYLIWPTLVLLMSRRGLRVLCVACVVGALALRCVAMGVYHLDIYFLLLTPCRIDALAIGAWFACAAADGKLTALLRPARITAAVGALLLLIDIFMERGLSPSSLAVQTVGLTVIALTSGAIIVIAVHLSPESRGYKILGGPVLGFFGKYSYGMYVIHDLISPTLDSWLPSERLIARLGAFAGSLAVLVYKGGVTTLLAMISWHGYESQFLKLKRYFEYGSTAKRTPGSTGMTAPPRITVVTPSFNQAPYLEQTIRSVLDQGYPNLEYIIIDGGSTDGSVDIIRRYADRLAYWVSEKDGGQTDAINKGMARATGELRAYLNSDDIYLPGALERVARAFREHPEADLFHGGCRVIDEKGNSIGEKRGSIATFEEVVDIWHVWWGKRNFVQPEVFWTRRIADKIGPFQTDLFMVMDYEYWTRIFRAGGRAVMIEQELAAFRVTPTQKSNQLERSAGEMLGVVERLLWDRAAPLPWSTRIRLQARWLYQAKFMARVRDSTERGHSRPRRLLGSLGVALRHPKIALDRDYRRRLLAAAGLRSNTP